MKHITQRQHEIIEGLMLGDGSLSRRKCSHNPVLRVQRSLSDEIYNQWLNQEFYDSLKCHLSDYAILDNRTNRTYSSTVLRTEASSMLIPYYKRWYPGDCKCIPDDLILTPLTMAIWFADDGCVKNVDKWSLDMKLAVNGFKDRDVEILVSKLNELLNVEFRIYQSDDRPTIRGFTVASQAFLNLIDPVFPPLLRKSDIWRNENYKLLVGKPEKPKCPRCADGKVYAYGKYANGKPKFKCLQCMSCFTGILAT